MIGWWVANDQLTMADRRFPTSGPSSRSSSHIHGRARPPDLSTSARWPPDNPHDSRPMLKAAPMTIGNGPPRSAAPPPLPPPKQLLDIERGTDLGWHFANRSHPRSSGPAGPWSTPHEGTVNFRTQRDDDYEHFERRESAPESVHSPTSPRSNELAYERPYEPYPSFPASTSSSQLQGESQLQRLNRKGSSNAYDQQLLSSLGGPKTPIKTPTTGSADGSPTSRRPSLQSPKAAPFKNLSISERSLSLSSDPFSKLNSPLVSSKWAASPQSQTGVISPGLASTSASAKSFGVFEEGSISSSMSSAPTREEFDRIGLRVPIPEPRSKRSDSSLSLAMSAMSTASHDSSMGGGAAGRNIGRQPQDPMWTSASDFSTSPFATAAPPTPTTSTTTAASAFSAAGNGPPIAVSPYSPYATSHSFHSDTAQHHSFNSPTQLSSSGAATSGASDFAAAAKPDPNLGGLRHLSSEDQRSSQFHHRHPHHHQHPQSFPLHLSQPPGPRILLDEPSSPSSATAHHLTQLPHHHRHTLQSRQAMATARKRPAAEMCETGPDGASVADQHDRLTTRNPHRGVSPAAPSSAAAAAGQSAFSAAPTAAHTNGSYASAANAFAGTPMQGTMATQTEHLEERALLASLDPGLRSQGGTSPPNLAEVAREASMAVQRESEGLQQLQNASASVGQSGAHICDCCPKKPKKFDSAGELQQHQNEKQYTCTYCPQRFKNKNEAERHQNSLHLRRHSWSCAALDHNISSAFHSANAIPPNSSSSGSGGGPSANTSAPTPTQASQAAAQAAAQAVAAVTGQASGGMGMGMGFDNNNFDLCGYCGMPFPNEPAADWVARSQHLTTIHKFGECNQGKKFFRADHFRQHLKHSHNGKAGKWTNMLENACMREEPPMTPEAQNQEQVRLAQQAQSQSQQQQQNQTAQGQAAGSGPGQMQQQQQQQQQNAQSHAAQAAQAARMQAQAQLAAAQVVSEHSLRQAAGQPVLSVEEQLINATAPVAMMGGGGAGNGRPHPYQNLSRQQQQQQHHDHDPNLQFRGREGHNLKQEQ